MEKLENIILPSLSIIMPALNEQENIASAIKAVTDSVIKFNIDYELVVIDDGSSDNTLSIVKKFQKENDRIKIIQHSYPHGVGKSVWEGFRKAEKEIVIFIPGDNENDPMEPLRYLSLFHEVDIVVPFIYNVDVRSRKRRLVSTLYRSIINLSFGVNLNYTNGTVMYRRNILQHCDVNSSGFFFQAEILIKLIRNGYLFAEVPNFLRTRNSGQSKAISMNSFFEVVSSYLRLFSDIHIKKNAGKRIPMANLYNSSISYLRSIEE